MLPLPKLGVGLAFQTPLRGLIERPAGAFDMVEVVPDIFRTIGNVTADLAATRIVAGEDGAGEDGRAIG